LLLLLLLMMMMMMVLQGQQRGAGQQRGVCVRAGEFLEPPQVSPQTLLLLPPLWLFS
jgi:hypothetical protein